MKLSLVEQPAIPGLEVRLLPFNETSHSWGIEVEIDGEKAAAGSFKHDLNLHIEGYDEPVTIQLCGYVAE